MKVGENIFCRSGAGWAFIIVVKRGGKARGVVGRESWMAEE